MKFIQGAGVLHDEKVYESITRMLSQFKDTFIRINTVTKFQSTFETDCLQVNEFSSPP